MTEEESSTPPPRRKPRHRWLIGCAAVAVILLASCLITATIAGRMWSSEPDHWRAHERFVTETSDGDLERLAADLQNRVPSELSEPSDAPRVITLKLDEANAWLDQRLDDWLAYQGTSLPPGVSQPMLATEGNLIIFAFRIEAERAEQIVSVYFKLAFEPDGEARLLVDRVELGRLSVPASTLAGLMEGTDAGEAAAVLRGERGFDPVGPIDATRQARLLGVEVQEDRLELEVVNENRAE